MYQTYTDMPIATHLNNPNIGITGESGGPLYERGVLQWTRSDGIDSDGRVDRRVGESGFRCDCAVGDVVVDGRVLLLLDHDGAVVLQYPVGL